MDFKTLGDWCKFLEKNFSPEVMIPTLPVMITAMITATLVLVLNQRSLSSLILNLRKINLNVVLLK